jgi:hypothetical protein
MELECRDENHVNARESHSAIGHSIAVPLVTHSVIQRNKRSWKHQVSRNQGKLKYFIIFVIISLLLFQLTM